MTDALRRGHLSPKMMENLQVLKYLHRQQRNHSDGLDFSARIIPNLKELEPSVSAETIDEYVAKGRLGEKKAMVEQLENPSSLAESASDVVKQSVSLYGNRF